VALRRVNISPLGVTRWARPKPPGAWRVIQLLAGLAARVVITERQSTCVVITGI